MSRRWRSQRSPSATTRPSPRSARSWRTPRLLMRSRLRTTSSSSMASGWKIRKPRLGPRRIGTMSPYSRAHRLKKPSWSRCNSPRWPTRPWLFGPRRGDGDALARAEPVTVDLPSLPVHEVIEREPPARDGPRRLRARRVDVAEADHTVDLERGGGAEELASLGLG